MSASFPTSRQERLVWRVFGLLLFGAGVSKLYDPSALLMAIGAYQLPMPEAGARLLAISLPWFEVFVGGCLLAGGWHETARRCLMGLLGVFTVVTGQAWIRGLELSCGCFNLPWVDADFLRFLESAPAACLRNLAWLSACLWLERRERTGTGVAHIL